MALIKNTYGGIITRGLGLPACCGLVTVQFGILCGCTVQVIPPPVGGGGGSYAISPGVYVPWPKSKQRECDRMVIVTVKFSEEKTWKRSYIVDVCNADRIVRVMNVVNSSLQRLSVGIEGIKRAVRRVTTVFDQKLDK